MDKIKKLHLIWNYNFLIGFVLVNIHYFRYLNLFYTKYIPYLDYTIDYSFYSYKSFFIRVLTFLLNIFVFKKRKKYPVLSAAYIWGLLYFLLSHEHDNYLFIMGFFIFLFMLTNIFYDKLKLQRDHD